eukprot:gene12043-5439_t
MRSVIFGSNVPKDIFYGNLTSIQLQNVYYYNSIETKLYFNIEKFNSFFFSKNETRLVFQLGANFYSKPVFEPNGNINNEGALETELILWSTTSGIKDKLKPIEATRLEEFHPAIFSFSLLVFISCTVLSLLFIKFTPLKVHGFIPFVSSLVLTLNMCSSFPHFIPQIYVSEKMLCYFYYIIRYPLNWAILSVVPLNLLRFSLLQYLNHQKLVFKKEIKKRWSTRVVEFLNKPFVLPSSVLIFYLVFVIISLLIFATKKFSCNNAAPGIGDTIALIILGIIFMSSFVVLISVDVVSFTLHAIQKLKKPRVTKFEKICFPIYFLKLLWKEDVFYFRIQIYFFGFCVVIPVLLVRQVLGIFVEASIVIKIILLGIGSFVEYIFMFTYTGLFILLSMINAFKFILFPRRKDYQNRFEEHYQNQDLWDLFSNFCELEYSIENVKLYENIQIFLKEKDQHAKEEMAQKIDDKYLNSDSLFEVNISSRTKNEFRQNLNSIDDNLIENLLKDVTMNLSDTWNRFVITSDYTNFKYLEKLKGIKNSK